MSWAPRYGLLIRMNVPVTQGKSFLKEEYASGTMVLTLNMNECAKGTWKKLPKRAMC